MMAISNSVRLLFLRIHPVKKLRVEQTFHPHLYEASTLYIEFSANKEFDPLSEGESCSICYEKPGTLWCEDCAQLMNDVRNELD